MTDVQIEKCAVFSKSTAIKAPVAIVWKAITDTDLIKQWMSEEEISIHTDWQIGGPFIIEGNHHWVPFKNKGTVLEFEKERHLRYTHLSSLSNLSDEPCNFSIIDFKVMPLGEHTHLELTLDNFPTHSIYRHLVFYWDITLDILKRFIENNNQTK